MQVRLLHAILSGIIIAIVLGFSLIPTTWRLISHEPTFGSVTNGRVTIGLIVSAAVIVFTLLSFRLVNRVED